MKRPFWFGTGHYEQSYWNDEAAYELQQEGAEKLRLATHELHSMCLEAVDLVVSSPELMDAFEIPEKLRPAIIKSWKDRERDFIGRFDFSVS